MQIPEKGTGAPAVLSELDAMGGGDVDVHDGRLFAYVFLANEEAQRLAENAHGKYLWSNGLDPLAFPSLLKMEQEVVAMAADHLRGAPGASGNVTSGGTESVMLAVRTAREWARAHRPEVERPQMVLPVTAHPCFHKGAQYFGLETVVTPVDPETFRADVDAMRRAVTDRTVLVAGSAPSYAHGVVDPIEEIGALAKERGILCHVDGCIGAFMLPFFRELGTDVPPFDFSVPGVTSMSMDFHKYAFSPKGASTVLYRDAELHRHQLFTYSGWTGYPLINATMQSSKCGGPIAATWALLRHLGREGYREIARQLAEGTGKILRGVEGIDGVRVLGEPDMCLVAVASDDPSVDVFRLCDAMKKRGWDLQAQLRYGELPENFHLTVMPSNLPHLDQWVADLRASVDEVKGGTGESALAPLKAMLDQIDFTALRGKDVAGLLDSVGLGGGGDLGGALGEINAILNELDATQRDAVLTAFYEYLVLEARPDR
ncbi:MAG: pyridoxal phosphate-dependent decarboxylase family protein [Myxococcota bacterium]